VLSNDQPQERFVELDTSQNTVIDIGGRLIYSQEFARICSDVVRNSFIPSLYNKLSDREISVPQVNLSEIINDEGTRAILLRSGSPWTRGRVRLRLVVEFEAEQAESKTGGSPLDDIRGDVGS
jgi:hypothetical protein